MSTLTHQLLEKLIQFKSVTPEDDGCQVFMFEFLRNLGFTCQWFNSPPVSNFYAQIGTISPLLVFAGHTDVVDTGPLSQWHSPPFELHARNNYLFGRGTADMKGSLAAMLAVAKRWVESGLSAQGSLGFLITSGEEGDYFSQGTPYVMESLAALGITIDYCVVGEPTSQFQLGDMIKVGRRGSVNATYTIHGKQGHVAYPHNALNPIHILAPALAELVATEWDKGDEYFSPTAFQITQIKADSLATNIIPGDISFRFNFRFSPCQTAEKLQQRVEDCLGRHQLTFISEWKLSGNPYLTPAGQLVSACEQAIIEVTEIKPVLSTTGGTSDARFIAPFGVEVVEFGLVNSTIHQINECIAQADLQPLTDIYYRLTQRLLTSG